VLFIYIHLGRNTVIRGESIVGIFDLDKTTTSKITRNFLKKSQDNNQIENVSDELPKSFVVTGKGTAVNVYICQVAPSTLASRSRKNALTYS